MTTDTDTAVPETITETDAAQLTARIRAKLHGLQESIDRLAELITTAYTGRVWHTLGYPDWDSYVQAEFGIGHLRLERDHRKQLVVSMRSAGMSTRAIGTALGVHNATAHRDGRVADATSPPVTGRDGKTYVTSPRVGFDCGCGETFTMSVWHCPGCGDHTPLGDTRCSTCRRYERHADGNITAITPPASDPVEVVDETPPRRALTAQFTDATGDLATAVDTIGRLATHKRFGRYCDEIAANHLNTLDDAINVLTTVVARLTPDREPE